MNKIKLNLIPTPPCQGLFHNNDPLAVHPFHNEMQNQSYGTELDIRE